jgi:hypothetical protein
MKKVLGVFGVLASLVFCGVALATGIIVHSGQTVTLPCVVSGSVIVEAGGTVQTGNCSSTTIQGTLDLHPGSTAHLCNVNVAGSLIARQVNSGSFFTGTVSGANRNDGSLSTTGYCGIWMPTIRHAR